jgi:hypothetical protein
MATTSTPGITVLADGRRFIDKRYLGVRIGVRVGAVTPEQAEQRLSVEIARVGYELARKVHVRTTFSDCAMRYVAQSQGKAQHRCHKAASSDARVVRRQASAPSNSRRHLGAVRQGSNGQGCECHVKILVRLAPIYSGRRLIVIPEEPAAPVATLDGSLSSLLACLTD